MSADLLLVWWALAGVLASCLFHEEYYFYKYVWIWWVLSYHLYGLGMSRLADIIRSSILEKYISSYMKERAADGVIVLRAGEGWVVSGELIIIY